jgi:hypothetical protein
MTPLYQAWKNMRRRCNSPTYRDYKYYGGRGIRVCNRWNSFENFAADMLGHPGRGWSLDRIENDGDYEPDNCWWAPPGPHQWRNRRSTILTEENVAEIRQTYVRGVSYHPGNKRTLAAKFGVTVRTITAVVCGDSWEEENAHSAL